MNTDSLPYGYFLNEDIIIEALLYQSLSVTLRRHDAGNRPLAFRLKAQNRLDKLLRLQFRASLPKPLFFLKMFD